MEQRKRPRQINITDVNRRKKLIPDLYRFDKRKSFFHDIDNIVF
jgi:hypothetical protein